MAKKLARIELQSTLRKLVMVEVRCTPAMSNVSVSPSCRPSVCANPVSMLMAWGSFSVQRPASTGLCTGTVALCEVILQTTTPQHTAARFARVLSQSFENERLRTRGNRHQTAAECHERYVDPGSLPLRAVVCLSAYRKLAGLYDMTLLVVSVNQPTQGVLGRLDVQGIAFDNGMKLAQHYLQAFRWEAAP